MSVVGVRQRTDQGPMLATLRPHWHVLADLAAGRARRDGCEFPLELNRCVGVHVEGVVFVFHPGLHPVYSSSSRTFPVPTNGIGRPVRSWIVPWGSMPSRCSAVARTSFGEIGVLTTSPPRASVLPTRFPLPMPPP